MNINDYISYQQKKIDEAKKLKKFYILLFHLQLFFILLAVVGLTLILLGI